MACDNPPIDNKALAETIDETQQIPEKDLISLLDDVADRFPHHDAILSLHQTDNLELGGTGSPPKQTRWTYSQLRKGSIRLAAHLAAKGMRHGSRIVAVFFNEAEWALLFWATVRLGCQFVPLDPRVLDHKKDALHVLNKVQPAAVFVSNSTMAERVDGIVEDMEHRPSFKCVASAIDDVNTGQGWTTMLKALSDTTDGALPADTVGLNDIVLILFTSGTTSRPKGCPHSAITIGSPALMVIDQFGLDPDHSLCQHLPSFHIFNIFLSLGFWLSGATVVLPSASFDPASCFRAFATSPKMHVPCVPSMVQALTTYASSTDKMATSSPFSILLGGAPLTPDILELSRTLRAKKITVGYGTTEGVGTAMNVMDANSLDVVDEEVCLGTVKSGARLRFCQPGSRLPISRGQIGEVHQGGLPVFSGYLDGSPEELAMCYQEEGVNWWASGDRGYLDEEGRLFLLGRYKDLIIRGGENISPVKIENCLGRMTGVHSAYVVGVADTVAGEVPVAVITRDSQKQVATSDLQAAVLAELGRSFSPTVILDLHKDLGREEFPTTTSGKIQKPSLRQWVTDYLEQHRRIEQSSHDVLTELLECWSAVTGLAREAIDPDASIKTFADSMMIIQFFNMASRKLPRYANSTLTISDTVRQQAEMLQRKKPEPTEVIVGSKCPDHEAEPLDQLRAEEVTTSRLAPLGFGWNDVEELIPMTDYFSHFARIPVRPYHWNPRIALVVDSSISEAELKQALYQWLERHPLFRATTVTYDDDLDLYVVMSPSSGWLEMQVTDGSAVDNVAALKTYRLNDASWDWLSRTGPLLKATLVPLRDPPGATGIVLHVHHIMFDYHKIHRALQDLRDLVSNLSNNSNAPLRPFHHYRSFARSYRAYRSSSAATEDVNFHVRRLREISKDPAAIWPPLRQDSDLLPLDPSKRRAFDTVSRSAPSPR
ncbi:acetyl-CoA synthetase-like protein [Aspergillus campestris IBT 28561]|uniref:Acetyl-CoA synthetase-like protein n=1 Tax=Aspergillus campestris (strain IBT 28561) TaxID=1392248 RepID=A0A2I1DEY0_ASPC2|nr:acetyl-CoA synthetase-like protein [Aspergillus campestris IBT 28561]PKY08439.1 acetyl-CoA synthetase-like protein [Aspergillus campestris IBT 28561]